MVSPDLSIIIPAYNEAEALPLTVERIRNAFAVGSGNGLSIELIIVSDGSTDGTFEVAQTLLDRDLGGTVTEFASNVGSHVAIRCGLEQASGTAIAIISADGQDPPEALESMLEALGSGIDIVWGRRISRQGDSWLTRTLARTYYRTFSALTRLQYPHAGLDFLVFTKRVRDAVTAFPERNLPLFLTIFNLGYAQTYVNYEREERVAGASGWTNRKKVKAGADMLIAVSAAPLRLLSVIGGIVGLAGLLFGLITAVRALIGSTPDTGWASLMTAISVMGGLILIGISVLGEYVWRTLDESRHRPLYLISRSTTAITPPRID